MVQVDIPICHNRVLKYYISTALQQAGNISDLPLVKLNVQIGCQYFVFDMLHFKSYFPPFA